MAHSRRIRSRTTPQSEPARKKEPARITRSQSRDTDLRHSQRGATEPRRNVREASGKSVDSINTDLGPNTGRATRASRRTAGRNLPTVEENAAVHSPVISPAAEDEAADVRRATPPLLHLPNDFNGDQSPGAQSNVSGTTAISSAQTVHDPAELDNYLMIECLDDLYQDASRILITIAPPNAATERLVSIASEAANVKSKFRRLLVKRIERFKEACGTFGEGDFINVGTVVASFNEGKVLHGSHSQHLEAVLHMANVATLAHQIATMPESRATLIDYLLPLDNTFPRNLIGSWELDDKTLAEQTFRLALEIRTQLTISLILASTHDHSAEPDALAHAVFFAAPDEDGDGDGNGPARLRGWEALGPAFGDDNLAGPTKTAVRKRIERIRETIRENQDTSEQGAPVDAERFEVDFPWHDFVTNVLKWASLRYSSLNEDINRHGGSHAIQELLRHSLGAEDTQASSMDRGRASQSQDAPIADSDSQGVQIPKTNADVAKTWKRRWELCRTRGAGIAEDASPRAAEDGHQPLISDGEDRSGTLPDTSVERSSMQSELKSLRERERQNKENMWRTPTEPSGSTTKSFYDRQKGATRVSWDEGEVSLGVESTSPGKSRGKKRRLATGSGDEDDEFEARVPSATRRAPVDREACYSTPPVFPSADLTVGQPDRRAAAVANTRFEAIEDGDGTLPSASEEFKAVKRQARFVSSMAGARAPTERRPWSDEEVNVFMELVAQFCHTTQPWANIRDADAAGDEVLKHRSNKDLKDKAVNIIKAHRLAGQALPPGFESFKLPASLKSLVDRRRGLLAEDVED